MLSRAVCVFSRASMVAVIGCVSGTALAGPDWVERGDAGSSFFTAQFPLRPLGVDQLGTIAGDLNAGVGVPDYEDLYFFRVTDPGTFSLTVESANFNAVLYLFDITVNNELYGRLGNDNAGGESLLPRITGSATDATGVQITRAGDYVLAVVGAGRVPVSRTGPIFNLASPTEISGPDGAGGLNPLDHWEGLGEHGQYRIVLEECDFPITPAPGSAVVGLMGLGCLARRRRR